MKKVLRIIKSLLAGWFVGKRDAFLPAVVTNAKSRPAPLEKQMAEDNLLEAIESYLCARYEFRFNWLTEGTEFRIRQAGADFIPLGQREMNSLCIEVNKSGINCWDRDVNRFIHSCEVPPYHPFRLWIAGLPEWDGEDRVRLLAQRVSTDELWVDGFRRWMLALTAQWLEMDELHANSVAPVLVSRRQGRHKSTFCKLLLPDALRAYYTDHYDLNADSGAVQKLAVFGLINLDELDKFSDRKMTLLKNVMQMADVNIRKAYQKGYSALPRIASFIATSNQTGLLTDPTGSRRFLCVEVEDKIDTSPVDHAQLYAQLKTELLAGERYWFTSEEEAAIIQHNTAFQKTGMEDDVFYIRFRIPAAVEEGEWLTSAHIFEYLKRHHPAAMRATSPKTFGRTLIALGLERRRTRVGSEYRVVRLGERETA